MIADVAPVARKPKSPPKDDTRELAKTLYLQGLSYPAISQETGVAINMLRSWCSRYGWRRTIAETRAIVLRRGEKTLVRQAADTVMAQADAARGALADAVLSQAEVLKSNPARSVRDLANSPERQGQAAVLKTVVDAAATVFGWGAESLGGVIALVEMPREGVIDVEASQVMDAETPQPVVVESSPDGITGQGQSETLASETPSGG